MADNRNPSSEAAATVGARERLTISRWTSKSFLAPSALVNVLVYELLFIFGDTLLDKVPPGSSVLCDVFPGFRFYFAPFESHLEGILIPLSWSTTRPVSRAEFSKKHTLWKAIVRHSSDMPRPPKL